MNLHGALDKFQLEPWSPVVTITIALCLLVFLDRYMNRN